MRTTDSISPVNGEKIEMAVTGNPRRWWSTGGSISTGAMAQCGAALVGF